MSFPGRPAVACGTCREKKVKCDQAFPECRRCVTKGLRCAGYNNDTQFVLRRRPATNSSPTGTGSTSPNKSVVHRPVRSLVTPLEDQAIPRFFYDYVLHGTKPGIPGGFLNFLHELYDRELATPGLWAALAATAYASLANQTKVESLKDRARQVYGISLTLLHQALQSPKETKKDSTLGTLMLLSMYELIMSENESTLWDAHQDGRLILLRLRGTDQFKTDRGLAMFRTAYTQLQFGYLARYMQPHIDLVYQEGSMNGPPRPIFPMNPQLAGLVTRVARLCASAMQVLRNPDSPPQAEDLDNMICDASILDGELVRWKENAPAEWVYYSVRVNSSQRRRFPQAFPSWLEDFQIYPDVRMALVWNFYRCVRIFLHHAVLCCLSRLAFSSDISSAPPSNERSFQPYEETLNAMADEVCASIPFSLGQLESGINPNYSHPKPIGGYLLMWPLHTVKTRGQLSEEKTNFVNGVLKFIRDGLGINHAQSLLDYKVTIPISKIPLPKVN
ncbi:hypothetical protein K432DRAFT_192747 [Lepidopterella palustris CBS 459.81]|uniref:Zn(2)-C6 fungal-type domain-containing protein n=1 Tax=Lepidopterella palustris CBS 459.81 TaxID=1314670 RepID=A0A8E2JIF6_9PEZI|nr:hypothetical protein K432DRAFT_192747 [Lepidopterella palustris CBS 459.81]